MEYSPLTSPEHSTLDLFDSQKSTILSDPFYGAFHTTESFRHYSTQSILANYEVPNHPRRSSRQCSPASSFGSVNSGVSHPPRVRAGQKRKRGVDMDYASFLDHAGPDVTGYVPEKGYTEPLGMFPLTQHVDIEGWRQSEALVKLWQSSPPPPDSSISNDEAQTGQSPSNDSKSSGAFTCTYHGCHFRTSTPHSLTRHKREAHRSNDHAPLNLESQSGVHKCVRINPSTGKPCNSVFSRSYDLIRHDETIHRPRKKNIRCGVCTEEKTFTRADALTRHMRVCHPEVPRSTLKKRARDNLRKKEVRG